MLRISSGTAKNIVLKSPQDPEFRGVQEVAKQALFNILGNDLVDATCLDLYAGSGSLGLEALSRGARLCDFVDKSKRTTHLIHENVQKCGFDNRSEVIRSDAVKYVANTPEKYDLIFVDPYYDNTSHIHLMKNLSEILNQNGRIAFFHSKDLDWDSTLKGLELKISDQRRFGKSYLTLLGM